MANPVTAEATERYNVDAAELGKFESLAAAWWDPSGPLATLHAINPLRVDYIGERSRLDGARVLDVGCGAGILSEALARRGARVTGIDAASQNIEAASAHANESGLDIEYRVGTAETLASAEAGHYDLVTCLELVEHLPDPDSAVQACADLVAEDGLVCFSTINRNLKSFLLAIVGAEYVLRMVPRGTHEYSKLVRPSELAQAARAAGLTVEDLTGLHFNPLTQRYRLGGDVDVNYFMTARRRKTS